MQQATYRDFTFPPFYSSPPFFTYAPPSLSIKKHVFFGICTNRKHSIAIASRVQPVLNTRKKQMAMWQNVRCTLGTIAHAS